MNSYEKDGLEMILVGIWLMITMLCLSDCRKATEGTDTAGYASCKANCEMICEAERNGSAGGAQ